MVCGSCFDIHADDGHWSDSAAAAAMFGSANSRLSRNQLTYGPSTNGNSVANLQSAITDTSRQALPHTIAKTFLPSIIRRLLVRMLTQLPLGFDSTLATEARQ
jgi:hypothetical protein